MAGSATAYLKPAILNLTLRGTAFTAVGTPYVSLHTAAPGDTGADEVTAGDNTYARQAATFAAPSGDACTNSAALEWLDLPGVTLVGVGIWDAASGGNCMYAGLLALERTISAGGSFRIEIGELSVSVS